MYLYWRIFKGFDECREYRLDSIRRLVQLPNNINLLSESEFVSSTSFLPDIVFGVKGDKSTADLRPAHNGVYTCYIF